MEEVRKELEQAFKFISLIPVYGDSVELLATAKEMLRKAYSLLEREEKKHG